MAFISERMLISRRAFAEATDRNRRNLRPLSYSPPGPTVKSLGPGRSRTVPNTYIITNSEPAPNPPGTDTPSFDVRTLSKAEYKQYKRDELTRLRVETRREREGG
jgi:hypothetical protein